MTVVRESHGCALHPRLPLIWQILIKHQLCAGCCGAPTCSVLLSCALPSAPLAHFAPFPWIIIIGFSKHCSHHSSGELSLSPRLPGHSPNSMPFLEALEYPMGIFVIALLTLYDMEVRCFLVVCFPTSLWVFKGMGLVFFMSVSPAFSTIPGT